MSLLQNLLGLVPAAGGAGLTYAAYDRLGDIGDAAWERGGQIAQDSANMAKFQPYGVTSSSGTANVGANGGVNLQLTPEQQALQTQLAGGASSMFDKVLGDTSGREQDIYDRIRAMQSPEEERQRMALEERLMGQGRLGVQTNMYGGTPEQLALAKAQEESQNSASYTAIELARGQQLQDANIGGQMLQGQYAPDAALLNTLGAGTQNANLASTAQRQSANLYGQGMFGGLEAQLGAGLGQANLMGQLGTGLLSGTLQPYQQAGGGTSSGFMDAFNGLLGIG